MPEVLPENLAELAGKLGLDLNTLLHAASGGGGSQIVQAPETVAQPAVQLAEGVVAKPAEGDVEKLTRELAESRQETDQVRKLAQTANEGRVIGSGGSTASIPAQPPNIGGIEPGIRWAYLNGLLTDEQLESKVGPLLVSLLKGHSGGVI